MVSILNNSANCPLKSLMPPYPPSFAQKLVFRFLEFSKLGTASGALREELRLPELEASTSSEGFNPVRFNAKASAILINSNV